MFNELIESKPKKQRSTGGTIFSVVMHAVLGGLLIYATANAGQELTKEKVEEVNPETVRKIEEKLHADEEVAQEKLHDLGERLHLTREANKDDKEERPDRKAGSVTAGKK